MKLIFFIIIISFLIVVPACAVNLNLTQKSGENYIRWMWNDPTTPVLMVYVDGVFIRNTTAQYYYLTDLRPMEEHRIDLYLYDQAMATASGGTIASPDEIGILQGTKTSSTTLNSLLFYVLLILLIALTVVTAVVQNPVKGFLLGIFTSILALVMSFIAAFFGDWLILFSIITGVLAVVFTILHGQQLMKNSYIRFPWS